MTNSNLFKSKLWYIIPIVGIILVCVPVFFWKDIIKYQEYRKNIETANYPLIKDINQEIKGVILSINNSSHYMGTSLYVLSNEKKFSLANQERNNLYNKLNSNLMRMLSVGDSIYKPANSDSIYVYRNDKEYYFILGKTINENK